MIFRKLTVALVAALAMTSAMAAKNSIDNESNSGHTPRGQLVHSIVTKWGPHVQEAFHTDVGRWAKEMAPVFHSVDMERLQRAANAPSFDGMNDELLDIQATMSRPGNGPDTLGELDKDLVYRPVQPCRIIDTRIAGGPITGATTRNFDVSSTGSYASQGGSASNCDGVGSIGSFSAAVINFTTVDPVTAGYLTAYPLNTPRPNASTLNYDGNDIKGNSAIVKLDQTALNDEMTVYTQRTTHLVADIVGYFWSPEATPLQCVDRPGAPVSVAAGAFGSATSPACASGYTQVSIACDTSNYNMSLSGQKSSARLCYFNNKGGSSAANATATTRCCRVPGR